MSIVMATLWQDSPSLWIIELDTPLPGAQSDQVPRWIGELPSEAMMRMAETLRGLDIDLPVHLTYLETRYTDPTPQATED